MSDRPKAAFAPTSSTIVRIIQRRNWVRATSAMPIILPNIRSIALTDETITSMTLEDFSSITELSTIPPKSAMNMYMITPNIIETII